VSCAHEPAVIEVILAHPRVTSRLQRGERLCAEDPDVVALASETAPMRLGHFDEWLKRKGLDVGLARVGGQFASLCCPAIFTRFDPGQTKEGSVIHHLGRFLLADARFRALTVARQVHRRARPLVQGNSFEPSEPARESTDDREFSPGRLLAIRLFVRSRLAGARAPWLDIACTRRFADDLSAETIALRLHLKRTTVAMALKRVVDKVAERVASAKALTLLARVAAGTRPADASATAWLLTTPDELYERAALLRRRIHSLLAPAGADFLAREQVARAYAAHCARPPEVQRAWASKLLRAAYTR
jgi:hypothetical protein